MLADANGNPVDLGTSGTNFYRTMYGFDEIGRQDAVYLPTGTMDRKRDSHDSDGLDCRPCPNTTDSTNTKNVTFLDI